MLSALLLKVLNKIPHRVDMWVIFQKITWGKIRDGNEEDLEIVTNI